MSQWYRVQWFPLQINLQPLLQQLRHKVIVHRVTEEESGQCLWVADADTADQLHDWLQQPDVVAWLREGPTEIEQPPLMTGFEDSGHQLAVLCRRYPVTLMTLMLALVGAAIVHWDLNEATLLSLLTFQPIEIMGDEMRLYRVEVGWQRGEYWRLVTPIFLHFDVLHIAFNGLWVWEFGRRIERHFGSFSLLTAVLITGVAGNISQYYFSDPSLFGGLSGVLYGLLGILWIHNRLRPHPITTLPAGVIGFMLFWLALCVSGVVTALFGIGIANAAHLGGLIAGVVMALIYFGFDKVSVRPL